MNGLEHQNFRVDLGGVITLLSKNLYSSPGVYVRELIQNAMDAIVARDAQGIAPTPRTITISPCGVSSPDSPADEFRITDAGIGVSPDQVEQFLATVGASSKSGELQRSRRTYLGQFGIGLLSCFLIADEITVTSRSAGPMIASAAEPGAAGRRHGTGEESIEWIGRSDGTYTVRTLTDDIPVGTSVRLRPRPDMIGWARTEQVTPLVRKYAEFLPASITVLTNQGPQQISRNYPWANDFTAHHSQVRQGVSPIYGGLGVGKHFDVIEVSDTALGLDGVVYIGASSRKRQGGNRVYVNDMLVDEQDSSLLPSWAFFGWAAINSTNLEPTASRESVVNNTMWSKTRRALGQAALRWLRDLADTDPERFAEFVSEHNLELRSAATGGVAAENLELAEVVLPQLSVQTTEGELRLIDVVSRNPNILYAASVKEFRTIASFNPGGRIVVNAGHALDQEILQVLPQVLPGVTVTRAYPASEVAALAAPTTDTEVLALELRATQALTDVGSRAAVRRFPTMDLPAVFVGHGQIDLASPGYGDIAHLVLNWDNRAVQALARTTDELVFSRLMQLLLVQARMAAQCDGPQDRVLLSDALDDIIVLAAGIDGSEVRT